jgi:hypothetical protein
MSPGRLTLGVDSVPLLSDWNGEATRAFGVAFEAHGMTDVPMQERVPDRGRYGHGLVAAGAEMPDIDAVIAAASSLSR